jgi:non-heme chloroperoxidase
LENKMNVTTYRINVRPGLDLDVGERGGADGRPVILIPGLSDSWPSYLPLIAQMPDDLRLITLSLRGHGDSGKTAPGYSLADCAGDVLAVIDALGLAQADVVGHSLGSVVAQKLAELAPRRVTSLALIGAFIRLGANPAVIELRDGAIAQMNDPVDGAFVREFQESAVGPDTPRKTIEQAVAESMKLTASDWKAALDASIAADLTHALDGFAGPVLVMHGKLDGFCLVEEQAELARRDGRRLVSLAHWGHSPHWEHPAEAASVLAKFIGEGR